VSEATIVRLAALEIGRDAAIILLAIECVLVGVVPLYVAGDALAAKGHAQAPDADSAREFMDAAGRSGDGQRRPSGSSAVPQGEAVE